MTRALSLHRSLRQPWWYVSLLLPVLPLLSAAFHEAVPGSPSRAALPWILVSLSLAMALGVPAVLDQLGWLARKEVEQLRPAWLASLFLVQLPMLGGSDMFQMSFVVFAGTCALLAAIPVGAEFQQRTMPALLSQPIARPDLWQTKSVILAAALLVHTLLFVAAGLVARLTPDHPRWLIAGFLAALAWATAPYWTLLTRSLLAGVVFTIAIPVLFLSATAGAVEWVQAGRTWSPQLESTVTVGWLLAGLLGGAVAARQARHRWLILEAPDAAASEATTFFPSRSLRGNRAAKPRSWFLTLVFKELRLQEFSLGALAITLLLFGVRSLVPPTSLTYDLLYGLLVLMGSITVLLAGSTAIAEERRLGTLESQVLLPVPRFTQWLLKVSGAAVPAAIAGFLLHHTTRYSLLNINDLELNPLVIGSLVAGGLAITLLTSSSSPNAVRALVSGLTLTAVCTAALSISGGLILRGIDQTVSAFYENQMADFEGWVRQAAQLAPDRAATLAAGEYGYPNWGQSASLALVLSTAIPIAAAGWFGWRNFARPALAGGRLVRQSLVILGIIVGVASACGIALGWQTRLQIRDNVLGEAVRHLQWKRQLSAGELMLYQQGNRLTPWYRRARIAFPAETVAQLTNDPAQRRLMSKPTGSPPTITIAIRLPLNPEDRNRILAHGRVSDEARELLQKEAASATNHPAARTPAP